MGVEAQLARAISNLVHNAIEATKGAGDISIRTARVSLEKPVVGFETIPSGPYAVLSVADNGCGIAPEELDRVFEPFFSTKRTGESSGTGLGLAIVHGVVKEHQGFINVVSRPGEGTTFTLYFPTVEPTHLPAPAKSAPVHGQARILVVDDDEMQLHTCRRGLASLGYTVVTESSGDKACGLFRGVPANQKSPFDLVVVDMLLGGDLDGWQVIRQIRSRFPDQKVLVASGHAPTTLVDQAVNLGLPWLAKPYALDTLAVTVANALREEGDLGVSNPS
jgi:ActR/RegA family two-component response regulator